MLFAILLTGCSEPHVLRSAGPQLDLLGPRPGFSKELADHPAAAGWALAGLPGTNALAVVDQAGVPALRVNAHRRQFALARRIDVPISIMPYLSWSWLAEGDDAGRHPVRMVVGFESGIAKKKEFRLIPGRTSDLPEHDRVLTLTWEGTALSRGSLFPPPANTTTLPARYAVRGGNENTGTWWMETVDLADLYHRAWPSDDFNRVRVVFVGIVAARHDGQRAMNISGVRLSR